jgi:ribokinase
MILDSVFDIVTIGSTTRDTFMRGDFPVREDVEAPSGRALHVPLGAKYEVKEMIYTLGGNAANVAVTFARHGLNAACFAEVGDDAAAAEVETWLRAEGIESLLRSDSQEGTPASVVMLSSSGERTIFAYHGANDVWESAPPADAFRAPWWYVSLSGETARHFPALMEYARAHAISVGFNPSGYHIRNYKDDLFKYLPDVAFLVLNQEEAALLVGMDWHDEKEVFQKLDELVSPGIVAVSYGPKGSAVSDGKNLLKAGIFPERQLKDRTGAGDAFGSGFVSVLIQHSAFSIHNSRFPTLDDLRYALRFASANATSVVEHIGATPGILTKKQFEADHRWDDLQIKAEEI